MDFRQFVARGGANPLDYEIAQEQASALGRLARALERSLAALAAHDQRIQDNRRNQSHRQSAVAADHGSGHDHPGHDRSAGIDPSSDAAQRRILLQAASNALWCFIVQREACGLRDPRPVIRDYRVPPEVENRMGMPAYIAAPELDATSKQGCGLRDKVVSPDHHNPSYNPVHRLNNFR